MASIFPSLERKPRLWAGGEGMPSGGHEHVRLGSPILQFASLVEDFTPIKPVRGDLNSFEDGMFRVGLFGFTQRQVFFIISIGLVYTLVKIWVG